MQATCSMFEFQAPVMCVVMSEAYGYGNQVIIPPFLNINHSTTENTEFQTPMSRPSVPSLYLPPLPHSPLPSSPFCVSN